MRKVSISWPKLLGVMLGLESLGLILWQLQWWWWRAYVTHGQVVALEWFWLAVATLLSLLSYCLYRAHGWARLVVIALGICSIAGITVSITIHAAENWARLSESQRPMTAGARVSQVLDVLSDIGVALCFMTPFALFVCVLCLRDVAATFRRDTTERE